MSEQAAKHDCFPFYRSIIDPLRKKAREMGYALTVHGTLCRDIDLVAIPWTEDAIGHRELAEGLMDAVAQVSGVTPIRFWRPHLPLAEQLDGCPGHKPHGRLCWTFRYDDNIIDLSVMPRKDKANEY